MLPGPRGRGFCKPCRESKSLCDKKKPRCSQCVASNKPCGGYDMGHIFINVNSDGPPPAWNRGQSAQKHLVLDLASQPRSSPFQPIDQFTSSHQPSSVETMDYSADDSSRAVLEFSKSGNVHHMLDQFLDLYYRRYAPGKSTAEPLSMGDECGGWRTLLPSWVGQSPLLDTAIGALAAAFIGTQYQDPNMMHQAGGLYLNALQMVQQSLRQLDSNQKGHLLATTLIMSSTELFMSNGGGPSQLTHIDGATRLLHLSIESMEIEELHVYILNQGLFEAISSRRSYPCSAPSFQYLARKIYSAPRTNQNHLFFEWCERMLPLPDILNLTDRVNSRAGHSTASPMSIILRDLARLEQSLVPWYDQLQAQMASPWAIAATQASPDSVPFPLQFASIEACTNYCLYWMSQLLILEATQSLFAHLSPAQIPEHATASAIQPRLTEYASLICRSVQYCTLNRSFAAAENMFLPLNVVAGYYMRQGDHDRMKWCGGAFARISHEQKIGFVSDKLNLVDMRVIDNPISPIGVWDEV